MSYDSSGNFVTPDYSVRNMIDWKNLRKTNRVNSALIFNVPDCKHPCIAKRGRNNNGYCTSEWYVEPIILNCNVELRDNNVILVIQEGEIVDRVPHTVPEPQSIRGSTGYPGDKISMIIYGPNSRCSQSDRRTNE